MIPARLIVIIAASCLAAHPARAGKAPTRKDFAVKAGRILTISGEELRPGVVVVRGGKFAAVGGADTPIPAGLEVIDASKQVLMPGFVDAHSQRGLDRTYETAANSSFVRVSDALNPLSLKIEDGRRSGITTMLVAPDNSAFIGGRTAIIHPQGIAIDEMVVRDEATLKISLQPGPGASRMGHVARLREILDETRKYMADREAGRGKVTSRRRDATGREAGKDDVEPHREALVALLEDRLPATIYCPTAADVATCFALANEYGFHVTPVLGPSAWRAASLLRTNHVTVVTTPQLEAWERQPDGTVLHVELPKVLHDAGVPFALSTDPAELGAQHPWFQAAVAVRAGVPRKDALAAITKVPAGILGFAGSKGVIRPGADADFLLLSDDPLSGRAWVDASWILGIKVYDRAKDAKLERLLARTKEPPLAAAEIDHVEGEEDDPSTSQPSAAADDAPAGAGTDELKQRWPVPPSRPR